MRLRIRKKLLLVLFTDIISLKEIAMSQNSEFNARLYRLETLIDTIINSVTEIKSSLSEKSRINWAPIAIGVTIFFTVCGSVATIYNTRISTLNSAVENLANRSSALEKSDAERQVQIENNKERLIQLEKDVEDLKRNEQSYHR